VPTRCTPSMALTIEDADGAVNDQVDAAYRAKYDRC
jgi:hypothetical protein